MANLKIKTNLVSKIRPEYDAQLGTMAEALNTVENITKKRSDDKEYVTYYDVDDSDISIDIAKLLVSKGGDVENYPVFIEVTPTDTVPESIPYSTEEDDEGNTVTKTWAEWVRANNEVFDREGKHYVATQIASNEVIKFSDLTAVFDNLVAELPTVEGSE